MSSHLAEIGSIEENDWVVGNITPGKKIRHSMTIRKHIVFQVFFKIHVYMYVEFETFLTLCMNLSLDVHVFRCFKQYFV